MTLKFRFNGETVGAALDEWFREAQAPIARAARSTIEEAAERFKTQARAEAISAGLGRKFANALRFQVYPKAGATGRIPSISAAVYMHSKIGWAWVHEEGPTLTGKPLMWLPMSTVPVKRGGKLLSASKFRQEVGQPLHTWSRPGKPPMLYAKIRATDKREVRGVSLSQLRRGRNPSGQGTIRHVPLYVGLKTAQMKKRISTASIAARIRGQLPAMFAQHFAKEADGG